MEKAKLIIEPTCLSARSIAKTKEKFPSSTQTAQTFLQTQCGNEMLERKKPNGFLHSADLINFSNSNQPLSQSFNVDLELWQWGRCCGAWGFRRRSCRNLRIPFRAFIASNAAQHRSHQTEAQKTNNFTHQTTPKLELNRIRTSQRITLRKRCEFHRQLHRTNGGKQEHPPYR